MLQDIDIRSLLPEVRTRTLVIHKTHDRILPVEAGRYFATHMPNAQIVEIPGADHFFFVESSKIIEAVVQFVLEKRDDLAADTWIGIVLYLHLTIVSRKEKVLDAVGKEHRAKGMFFPEHEVIYVFDSPSRAIQCALKLRDILKDESLKISLHVGECNVEDGKPAAAAIDVARRAAAFAPQNKIVVTQTLRDILSGSGVVFDLRRIHIEKQTSQNVALYALAR